MTIWIGGAPGVLASSAVPMPTTKPLPAGGSWWSANSPVNAPAAFWNVSLTQLFQELASGLSCLTRRSWMAVSFVHWVSPSTVTLW